MREHLPTVAGVEVSLSLTADGGALIKLNSAACVTELQGARPWWFEPRSLNHLRGYPERSLKSATCKAWLPRPRERPTQGATGHRAVSLGGTRHLNLVGVVYSIPTALACS